MVVVTALPFAAHPAMVTACLLSLKLAPQVRALSDALEKEHRRNGELREQVRLWPGTVASCHAPHSATQCSVYA